jgi:hypothetical protein
MQTQSNAARVPNERQLRIGVFSRKAETLEEILIPPKQAVSIGTTPDCTIALPYARMEKIILLQPSPDGRYSLCFTPSMSGNLKTQNRSCSLAECIEEKLAAKHGDMYQLSLPYSAQGRIELFDAVLLFSFVPMRARATPLLSKELQPEFLSSVDRPFIGLLALSFLLHAGVAWMAYNRIVPEQEPLFLEETLASLIHQPAALPPPIEDAEEIISTNEEPLKEETKAPAPAVTHKSTNTAAPSDDEKDGRVGLVAVLGRQSAEGGPFTELFQNDPLAAIDGLPPTAVKAAKDGDDLGESLQTGPKDSSGELSSLDRSDIAPDVPTSTPTLTPKKEKPVKPIVIEPIGDPPPCSDCGAPPNPGDVLRPYRGRIQACYERELPNNENLAGKLTSEFSLSAAGRVLRVEFTADTLQSEVVSSCVANVLKSVKFPPLDGETKVSVSFIFDKQ